MAKKTFSHPPVPRGPYTTKPKQQRVFERYSKGESIRHIGTQEHLDRTTIKNILSQEEFVQMTNQAQSRLARSLGMAAEVYVKALRSKDLKIALPPAMRLLESFQVLPKGGIELPKPEVSRQLRYWQILGQMADMTWIKSRKYGNDLPPGLEERVEEAKRRAEEEALGKTPEANEIDEKK